MINSIPAFSIPVGEALLPTPICDHFKDVDTDVEQDLKGHSVQNIHFLDDYVVAKDTITKLFEDFAEEVYGYRQDWRITTSWLTSNPEGKPMFRHRHANCIYSGVLYPFTYTEDHAPLILENPLIQLSSFDMRVDKPGPFFSDYIGTHPIPRGQIIFFPSYLYHYHPPFKKSDLTRKSIAFNLFPDEEFGVNESVCNVRSS